ncbi:MAG: TonB-dependent vitamin B12 receptor [Pseudomonadota bacterium]
MAKRRALMLALLLLKSPLVLATEADDGLDGPDEVIVTASRGAQTVDETLASVTVVTRDEIERQLAQSLEEALRAVPGLSLANSGGLGKTSSVFLRGTESDHVLVLLDGVKIGSATSGTTAFEQLPIELIERIEIVRGPRSSLYGSEAIGGVIQIFTRKGGGALKPFFSAGGGSYETFNAVAGLSGGGERGWFNLSASGIDSQGFNACRGRPFPDGAGCFTDEPDKDGYRRASATLRAGYRFDNGVEVDAHALRAIADTQFDGGFVNESETVQQVLGGRLGFSPLSAWQVTLTAGRSRDDADNFKDGVFKSRFDTERDSLSFLNEITLAGGQLMTLGVDYQDDRVGGTTAYSMSSRDNIGLFTQYQGGFGAHDLQFSARLDDNAQFGTHVTGAAAWGYALGRDMRLTAAFGSAFKAPTFNELYFPGFGNPDLKPETARSFELGLSSVLEWGRWSLNAYDTRIRQLIGFDAVVFLPANIDKARIRGLEAVMAARLAAWDVAANLTLLDPVNRSEGENRGNLLPRRPRQSFRLTLDRVVDRFGFGATLLVEGKRYDDLANGQKLDGYMTLDVRAEYALSKAWKVQARLANVANKQYETAAFFNQPGRNFFLTLRYQP